MARKRSQLKKRTRECQVLRYMRRSRGISQKLAAERCGLSEAAIGHYEQGRMGISPTRLQSFLKTYGYEKADYDRFLKDHGIGVLDLKEECLELVKGLSSEKLGLIYGLLSSLKIAIFYLTNIIHLYNLGVAQ